MDRRGLAGFLRSRRESLQPEDVGVVAGARRRVRGLRREEVAHLAAMSVDYYGRLERGSGTQPSTSMLDVLVRVFRLSLDERDHLYRLAGHNAPDRVSGTSHVSPALQRVLDNLSETPAFVVSDIAEPLAQNLLAAALFGDWNQYTGNDRSGIYRWFMRPDSERAVYPPEDRERQGRSLVASLRIAVSRRGTRSVAARLALELERNSPEFAELWADYDVANRFEDHKALVHPEVGTIHFDCQALFNEDQSQTLVVLSVPPRSAQAEKLQLLSVLGSARFTTPDTHDRGG
ncbi:helix-turn-helix domain-containing protein [Nocardiopsis akebiae]|uniref:Helix-turn-helix domain-containing protein n=2 Tax=Nocardiopsis akebiae TaxID=2831968 RepID=A0ABX8CBH2_9ACTN|nr:helix-turn-helix domain-containing protein [Nocardiopsis akebiae]